MKADIKAEFGELHRIARAPIYFRQAWPFVLLDCLLLLLILALILWMLATASSSEWSVLATRTDMKWMAAAMAIRLSISALTVSIIPRERVSILSAGGAA